MTRRLVALAAAGALVTPAACGDGDETVTSTTIASTATVAAEPASSIESGLEFATLDDLTLTLNLHIPAEHAGAPIVLTDWMVDDLVEEGMIVVVIDDFEPPDELSGGPEEMTSDHGATFRAFGEMNACAIRFARARAAELGSEEPIVVLSSFSAGAGMLAQTALFGATLESRWDEFATTGGPSSPVECSVTGGSSDVDAIVGVAGAYDLFMPIYDGLWGRAYQQEHDPEVQEFLAGAIGANPDLKVRLIHGTADDGIPLVNSEEFAAALTDAGYDVQLTSFEGGHELPPTELGVSTILEVLGR